MSSLNPESSPNHPRRYVRSGAPSADTRHGFHTASQSAVMGNDGATDVANDSHETATSRDTNDAANTATDDGDDPVMIMEVRQKVKIQPEESGMERFNRLDMLPSAVQHNLSHHSPASHPSVSFVAPGFTAIGDKVKALNDTLGEIQSWGIQHVTSLPELVLVGDQSAGKSSLMSSFSGIYLPRDEGACTRCPIHIRLSGSQGGGSWTCRVSLQRDYEYGQPSNVTRRNPFGPWVETSRRDVKDFANLGDPSKIEETLRWAQIATLNPSTDHSLFKPGTGEIWKQYQIQEGGVNNGAICSDLIQNEAGFSPNTVALDISAPDLADLSFYDLPGVFTSARHDEDQYLVKVVENLTAKYISHKQAIILWAVPMNADPETSSTFSIIRAQKAQDRTIGIMTKADLLSPSPSAALQWMAMLRGEQHVVGHGYFITARPVVTQDLIPDGMVVPLARDPSRPADDLGRQSAFEEAFFNKQLSGLASQEWPDCFRDFEDRCGVSRLVAFMSQRLGHEFAKCLPEIKHKVTTKLLDVNRELAQFPDMPENPELEIRRSLAEFASQVRSTLEGPDISPCLTEILKSFQHDIEVMKPRYIVKVHETHEIGLPNGRSNIPSRIDLTRDTDDMESLRSVSPRPIQPLPSATETPSAGPMGRRRPHADFLDDSLDAGGPSTPSKRSRGAGVNSGLGDNMFVKAEMPANYNFSLLGAAGTSGGRTLFPSRLPNQQFPTQSPNLLPASRTLQAVRNIINAKSKPGMPNIVTEAVYEALGLEMVKPWDGPLRLMLDKIYKLLTSKLHGLLSSALSSLRGRLIFKEASAKLQEFLDQRLDSIKATLMAYYQLETRKFYTLDKDSLARYKESEEILLTRHRHYYRMNSYLQSHSNSNGNARTVDRPPPMDWDSMAEEDRIREKVQRTNEMAKLGPDPYEMELAVCGYVRGYYRTASMRFVDTCTLHVVSGLVPEVAETLSKWYLDAQLGVFDRTTPNTFLNLMDEDRVTAERRARLKEDRQRFERTMESIQRLESSRQEVDRDFI